MDLRATLELNKKKFEEETLNEKTYKHILDRLNQEKIAFEVHSNDLHKQLKSASELLENEKLKSRKNYEAISLSKNSLKTLRICAEYDHRQKQERISGLEKTALSRKEAAERREERIRKIAEIADIAANENTESQEINIKQSLLLHKIWFLYLKHKLEKKLKGAIEVEDAYQSIRSATGLQNINEIVNNFVGKEENQAQLTKSVQESNKTLDEIKLRYEKSKIMLKELMLVEGTNKAVEFINKNRELDEEITIEKKYSEKLKEEFNKIEKFYEEVWE